MERDGSRLFSTIALPNGKKISACEMVLECSDTNYRLYVDVIQEGFYAMAVSFASCSPSRDPWECPELEVDELFTATAFFDGVRHLEFNRHSEDEAGYLHYPDMAALSELFKKVSDLENSLCPWQSIKPI